MKKYDRVPYEQSMHACLTVFYTISKTNIG